MEVITSIEAVKDRLSIFRSDKKSIGLVPTMGCIHDGHLQLIRTSIEQNNITVCTIFVNPTQFNNSSDLENYPRSLEKDLQLFESSGVDIAFTPSEKEIYPALPSISLNFGEIEKVMEGKFRPGHFNGVGLVVAKLFNILGPDRAYFGHKDIQQLIIIRQLVRDLNFGIEIVGIPTVREKSGLAMSSRNERLDQEQKKKASIIYKSLQQGRSEIINGADLSFCRETILKVFASEKEVVPEYVEFIDLEDSRLINEINQTRSLAICVAAFIDDIRLIDNLVLELE